MYDVMQGSSNKLNKLNPSKIAALYWAAQPGQKAKRRYYKHVLVLSPSDFGETDAQIITLSVYCAQKPA